MDGIVVAIVAHDKKAEGCRTYNSDIMLSLITENAEKQMFFNDFYLSNTQAKKLIKQLEVTLEYNGETRE